MKSEYFIDFVDKKDNTEKRIYWSTEAEGTTLDKKWRFIFEAVKLGLYPTKVEMYEIIKIGGRIYEKNCSEY